MIILFAIATLIWLLWLIGFPIYKKCIKKEPLWNSCYANGELGILYSPGFGAGRSTWDCQEIAYDKRIVKYWLN